MLSKSTAAILLFLALAVAAFGGGYLAIRTFGTATDPLSDDELRKLQLEVDALDTTGKGEPAAGGQPAGGAAGAGASGAGSTGGGAASQGGSSRGGAPGGGGGGATGGSEPAGGGTKLIPIPKAPVPQVPGTASSGQPAGAVATAPGGERGGAPGPEVARTYEEVMVQAGEILDLQLQTALSSETAKVEDLVEARIIKDVRGGNFLAIPQGTKLLGSISKVDKGSSIKEAARLEVIFHTIVMKSGDEVPVRIDPLMHIGPSPSGDSKAKIGGGAAAGAALGWLKGGVSGAIRGGAIGGGAGAAVKMVEGRKPAELPAGAQARVELRAPIFVTILR